jgi:hypothetical protein
VVLPKLGNRDMIWKELGRYHIPHRQCLDSPARPLPPTIGGQKQGQHNPGIESRRTTVSFSGIDSKAGRSRSATVSMMKRTMLYSSSSSRMFGGRRKLWERRFLR